MRRSIPLDGGTVSQLFWGTGALPLHFAHATGFNAETYRGVLAPLGERFAIAASDARGHGLSTLPMAPGLARDWAIFRDDLRGVLERTAPGGAILAGHSMGATVSLMIAAERPDLVRALVLIEPVLVPRAMEAARGEPELAGRAAKRRDKFPSLDAALTAYRGRGAFRTWSDATIADYLKGGTVADGDGIRLSCSPAWEAECFRSTPFGVSELAKNLRCRVTLIRGENGTASESEVAIFTRLHPATRVVQQPGASHFLPMEFPDLAREEIERIAT